jgi:hypothetical protein
MEHLVFHIIFKKEHKQEANIVQVVGLHGQIGQAGQMLVELNLQLLQINHGQE